MFNPIQPPTPYLLVENLSHSFSNLAGTKNESKVLDKVSFRLYPGQFTALVGETGSGKSTLARLISGQLRVQEGAIYLNGREISSLSKRQRRRAKLGMQMVFQDPYSSLNPLKTIGWQLEEPLRIQGKLKAAERSAKVRWMLDEVGLDPEIVQRYPQNLSGGQRQRIAIACAIITEPELLIADEAVSALDLSVQAQIINLLIKLREAHAFACLFISHDLDVVQYLCDRVVVLNKGIICEEDKVSRVFAAPKAPYTAQLLAARGKQLR